MLLHQRAELNGESGGVAERDVVLLEVVDDTVKIDGRPTTALQAGSLRQRFRIAPDEAVSLLIGKDGEASFGDPMGCRATFCSPRSMRCRCANGRCVATPTDHDV